MKKNLLFLPFLLWAAPRSARAADSDKLKELERKINVLTDEIEKMKLGEASSEPDLSSVPGFGPAASKIYQKAPKRVSIGGYGEFVYQSFAARKQNGDMAGMTDRADLQRAVIYIGYKFNDWILFNSEIEFEHAGSGEGGETRGEVSAEQAYLDFKLSKPLGVRAGLVIVPMGLVNETHEPTAFHGVRRPSVETFIIPSTWRENGAGVFGELGPVTYRSYVVAGLAARSTKDPDTDGFTGASAIRGGRTEGTNSFAQDKAWASRVDIKPVPGVVAGASLYVGQADHNMLASVPVGLWDAHAALEYRGAELKALYAEGRIGNADSINLAQGFTNAAMNSVGRRFFGGYAEAAFDVLSLYPRNNGHYLAPFFRYERYDTQAQTPGGFSKDPANSHVEYTLGLTYKPIPQVAVKTDYQWLLNQAHTGVNQWNLGLGYIF